MSVKGDSVNVITVGCKGLGEGIHRARAQVKTVHNEEDTLWWMFVGEKPSRGFLRCGWARGESRATPTHDKKYECYEQDAHNGDLSTRFTLLRDSRDGEQVTLFKKNGVSCYARSRNIETATWS